MTLTTTTNWGNRKGGGEERQETEGQGDGMERGKEVGKMDRSRERSEGCERQGGRWVTAEDRVRKGRREKGERIQEANVTKKRQRQ